MSAKNILIICPDRRLLGDLAPLISQGLPLAPVVELTHYPDRRSLMGMIGAKPVSLCFVDIVSNKDLGTGLVTDLAAMSPSTVIVAMLGSNDPDLILKVLRQGATEFLLYPFAAEQLRPVLARLVSSGPGGGAAKVISVLPVKGACGASTIASNLAYQWKRFGAKRTLLADFDPVTGTISFLLKLKSNYSFLDALSRAGTLDGDLWKGLVSTSNGIDVLLSPENPTDAGQDISDPTPVMDFVRYAYEYVTIDLGSPYTRWSIAVAAQSDDVVLVSTNELPALRAAQRVLAHLDKSGIDRGKIRLVINRFNPEVGLNQDAIETALRCSVFQMIPSDYDSVQRALVDGKPISPGSGFGKSLGALADNLSGKKSEAPQKKKSGWGSLLTSLVSRGA